MIKAVLLILEKQGKIIFVRRTKKRTSLPDKWALPSEKIEKGETKEAATIRCADEELGINLKDISLFNEYHFKDKQEEKILYFMKANYIGKPYVKDKREFNEFIRLSFNDFFSKYDDSKIGHGLQYLRKEFYN
jgi:mutator protein MutT